MHFDARQKHSEPRYKVTQSITIRPRYFEVAVVCREKPLQGSPQAGRAGTTGSTISINPIIGERKMEAKGSANSRTVESRPSLGQAALAGYQKQDLAVYHNMTHWVRPRDAWTTRRRHAHNSNTATCSCQDKINIKNSPLSFAPGRDVCAPVAGTP